LGILSGIVSYLFGLTLNLMDACIDGFLGALGFDLNTFETYFPAAKDYHDVIIGFAIGLLFIMLIFQIFRNFGVVLDIEAEDPLKLIGKTALFLGMIVCSRSIINFIIGLLVDPYAIFLGAAEAPYEFQLATIVTSMLSSVFSNPFMSIVALIMFLVLGWQFLKLTVECVERYIVFYFVLYCAPVVFTTGAFKSTATIFKSWCRMVGSQALLLLLNIWSIKLFLSFMPVFEADTSNIAFNFLMGLAFLKFAQKADTLLRILGLNTASTGEMVRSLGGTIASIAIAVKSAGGMAQNVKSAASRIFGGASGANGAAGINSRGSGSGNGDVSSMSGASGGPGGGGGSEGMAGSEGGVVGGVTHAGISAAKQSYISDVLSSARGQMPGVFGGGNAQTAASGGPDIGHGTQGSSFDNSGGPIRANHGDSSEGNINMEPGGNPNANPSNIDAETKEGLNNLAHGLHHDQFDPDTKSYSGGEMPEFTGQNANIIGSAQLSPAEGFSQTTMKMPDGTTGTVYRNDTSGEAHVVQFGSVDNGVIQGTISNLDPSTGRTGEDFAFKAIHSSLPGADSFSSHSVPVSDGFGGAYHLATGGNTGIFAASDMTSQASDPSNAQVGTRNPSAQDIRNENIPMSGPAVTEPSDYSRMDGSGGKTSPLDTNIGAASESSAAKAQHPSDTSVLANGVGKMDSTGSSADNSASPAGNAASQTDSSFSSGGISKMTPSGGYADAAGNTSQPVNPSRDATGGASKMAGTDGRTDAVPSPADSVQHSSGSSYSPGGVSKMAAPESSPQAVIADGNSALFAEAPTQPFSGTDTKGNDGPSSRVFGISSDSEEISNNSASAVSQPIPESITVTPSSSAPAAPPDPAPHTDRRTAAPARANASPGMEDNSQTPSGPGQTVFSETPQPVRVDAESLPVKAGMSTSKNEVRRFSKENPANLEVFRRGDSRLEQFSKPSAQAQTVSKMNAPNKPDKK
jgi:hypothetical protein